MGHEPHILELTDNQDKIIVHKVIKCQACNISLDNVPLSAIERRQRLDIPAIKINVEEHRSEVKVCTVGSKVIKGQFPLELTRTAKYDKGVYSFIAACQNLLMIPYERTSEFFRYLFNHKISEGTIKNINEHLYNSLEETELKIKEP